MEGKQSSFARPTDAHNNHKQALLECKQRVDPGAVLRSVEVVKRQSLLAPTVATAAHKEALQKGIGEVKENTDPFWSKRGGKSDKFKGSTYSNDKIASNLHALTQATALQTRTKVLCGRAKLEDELKKISAQSKALASRHKKRAQVQEQEAEEPEETDEANNLHDSQSSEQTHTEETTLETEVAVEEAVPSSTAAPNDSPVTRNAIKDIEAEIRSFYLSSPTPASLVQPFKLSTAFASPTHAPVLLAKTETETETENGHDQPPMMASIEESGEGLGTPKRSVYPDPSPDPTPAPVPVPAPALTFSPAPVPAPAAAVPFFATPSASESKTSVTLRTSSSIAKGLSQSSQRERRSKGGGNNCTSCPRTKLADNGNKRAVDDDRFFTMANSSPAHVVPARLAHPRIS